MSSIGWSDLVVTIEKVFKQTLGRETFFRQTVRQLKHRRRPIYRVDNVGLGAIHEPAELQSMRPIGANLWNSQPRLRCCFVCIAYVAKEVMEPKIILRLRSI